MRSTPWKHHYDALIKTFFLGEISIPKILIIEKKCDLSSKGHMKMCPSTKLKTKLQQCFVQALCHIMSKLITITIRRRVGCSSGA